MINISIQATDAEIRTSHRRVYGNSQTTITVTLAGVEIDDLLDQLDEDDILDFIGRDKAKEYFNLKEENE